jgi:hypothetical protein
MDVIRLTLLSRTEASSGKASCCGRTMGVLIYQDSKACVVWGGAIYSCPQPAVSRVNYTDSAAGHGTWQ